MGAPQFATESSATGFGMTRGAGCDRRTKHPLFADGANGRAPRGSSCRPGLIRGLGLRLELSH